MKLFVPDANKMDQQPLLRQTCIASPPSAKTRARSVARASCTAAPDPEHADQPPADAATCAAHQTTLVGATPRQQTGKHGTPIHSPTPSATAVAACAISVCCCCDSLLPVWTHELVIQRIGGRSQDGPVCCRGGRQLPSALSLLLLKRSRRATSSSDVQHTAMPDRIISISTTLLATCSRQQAGTAVSGGGKQISRAAAAASVRGCRR